MQKSASSGGDAFSDLIGGTISSSTNTAHMTIAQRAALAEKQKQEQLKSQASSSVAQSSAWAGLDALGSSSSLGLGSASSKPSAQQADDDDWTSAFNQPAKPASTSLSTHVTVTEPVEDDWGLEDFVSKPTSVKAPSPQQSSKNGSLWELDEFASPAVPSSLRASPGPQNGRSSTPGSFDFGDREDGLLNDASGDEDDILGELGRPAQPKPTRPQSDATVARATPSPQPATRSRAVSPPPHVLGQIVEMGFSVQQARIALAATDTGLDVEAALEMLLSNGAASSATPPPEPRVRERERPRERRDEDPALVDQRIPGRRDRQREQPVRENSGPSERNIHEHADKLLSQASEIGLSMFNRANALWRQGKEKVQQAYEERAAASGSAPSGSRGPSRPKWMQDSGEDGNEVLDSYSGGFRDDDVVHAPPKQAEQRRKPAEPKAAPPQRPQEEAAPRVKTGDLLSADAPSVYVSPFRRKVPPRTQSSASAEPVARQTPPKAPSPAPLVQRKTVPASPSEIATSAKHKAAGTEMFKLGRYAEAETSYSYAIAALPESHLLLVPLYNNRALTRIKTGDHNGAIEDCTAVLRIIGAGFHPAREAKVTGEREGAGVDLADAYVKALRRRAEAYEGKEKWDDARKDWEAIAAAEWAGRARNEAAQAAGRCRRMLHTDPDAPAAAPAPPKPKAAAKARAAPRLPTPPPSDALNRVREANEAAEAEEAERHALKDAVEARLAAWKGGKEANIRALIASLDTVLWPELGWQKVGMHELVTPAQVKVRYTKAIAKLHPDKLNARNTTLEQRMIANGVFGSLNDAWNAFKQ